jgi:hypothetical protein
MTSFEARTLLDAALAASRFELVPRLDISAADFVACVKAAPDLIEYGAARYGERLGARYRGTALRFSAGG